MAKTPSKLSTLDEIEVLLAGSPTAEDVFGDDVKAGLQYLELVCHPDRHPGDAVRATKLFQQLQALAAKPKLAPQIVKSPKRSYTLGSIIGVGDVADVYAATSDGEAYVVKVSRVMGAPALLELERTRLAKILTAAGDTIYRKHFPLLVESFLAGSRRVTVFAAHDKPLYSAEQIRAKHPGGLPGEHLVWMAKRLFTAIGFAHLQKIVHGTLTPAHLLYCPADHGLVLVGWGQSVEVGQAIKHISVKYKDFYPKEVDDKKPATPETDVYMAAKCLRYLAGDVVLPAGWNNFLRALTLPSQAMRPGNAWGVHDDLDDMASRLYGPPRFVPLTV
jgi:hypothetical protein